MPNDIDAVRELREAQQAYTAGRGQFGSIQRRIQWETACVNYMPAILKALESVTGERDAALAVMRGFYGDIYEFLIARDTFKRTRPHLFKTESEDARK